LRLFITAILMLIIINLQAQRPNLQLRVFAGMNVFTLKSKSNPLLDGVSVGYLGGFGARITKRKLYGEMNFNFIRSGIPLELQRIGSNLPNSTINISAFEIPIVAGYKFANTAFFKWSMYTGINTIIVTRVKQNDLDFTKSDMKNPQFGLRGGSGIDFAFFTFNFHYTYGLNKLIKNENRTNNHLMEFNIGVIF